MNNDLRSHAPGKQLHQIIAEALVREFDVPCCWQEFHSFARKSGLSGERAAKTMRRLLLKVEKLQGIQKRPVVPLYRVGGREMENE